MTGDSGFGPELRRLRHAARLTIEELAGASGVSVRAISEMERGRSRGPQHRTVEALAGGLRLSDADRVRVLELARAGRPRPSGPPPGLCDLPRAAADFTGRAAEALTLRYLGGAAAGTAAPQAATAVVISGPAGVGKTTLAVHAASMLGPAFSGGQFFVDLRGMDARPLDPAEALARLLRALGARDTGIPPGTGERAARFRSLLAGRQALIIVDNAADEAQARPLLPGNGPGMVIVTSRRLLSGLEGVHRLPLSPMAPADAGLLLARIMAASSSATPDLSGLDEVAALCGHLPLALRIAGNRLASQPGWTPPALARQLADQARRLDRLTAGDLQVTAAFMLSYHQLTAPAQAALRAVSLIPGPDFSAELASVVAGVPVDEADDALEELTELGLLNQSADRRYSFHDLIRLFAAARLDDEHAPAERTAMELRMTEWLLGMAIVAGRWFEPGYGPPPPDWHDLVDLPAAEAAQAWLQAEGPNWLHALHTAAAAGHHEQVLTVADSLHWFSDRWTRWGHWHKVYALSADAAHGTGDPRQEATHLNYLAWAQSICQGRHQESAQTALHAAALAEAAGDLQQHGLALYYAGDALGRSGENSRTVELSSQAAPLLRQAGDRDGHIAALTSVAYAYHRDGQHAEFLAAWETIEEALRDPATAPQPFVIQATRANCPAGSSHAALGHWKEAIAVSRDALTAARELGIPAFEAHQLFLFSAILQQVGEWDEAALITEEAIDLLLALGDHERAASAQERLHAIEASQPPPQPHLCDARSPAHGEELSNRR